MRRINSFTRQAGIFLTAIFIFLALANITAADGLEDARNRGTFLAGVKTDFPPFGYVGTDGRYQGFDIAMARYLAKALFGDENKVTLVGVSSGSRIPFLLNQKVDMIIATMTMSGERAKKVDFSRPYFYSGSMLLVTKDSPIKGIEDLQQKPVAVIEGSIQEQDLEIVAPQAKKMKFNKVPEALEALRKGQVEAFCQDDVLILTLARNNPDLNPAGKPFIPRAYAIATRKGETRFMYWINDQLSLMKSDGTYDRLWQQYFGDFEQYLIKP